MIIDGLVSIKLIETSSMLADLLTKALLKRIWGGFDIDVLKKIPYA